MTSTAAIIHDLAVGASEIASVIEISPWGGRWKVFARKRRKHLIEEPEVPWQRWGKKVQRPIAELFTEDTGLKHEWSDESYFPPEHPYLRVSVDAFIPNKRRPMAVLEAKAVAFQYAGHWEKTYGKIGGEDGVPDYVAAQLQLQLAAHQLPVGYVAAAIANGDMRYYKILADPEIQQFLLREAQFFFEDYILPDIEPPIEYSEVAKAYLQRRFPRERENLREATEEEIALLDEYADVRAELKPKEKRKKQLETELKQAVGDATGLEWERGKFTWKLAKDASLTNWRGLAEAQLALCAEEQRVDLLERYAKPVKGVRKIYFKDSRRGEESED